MFSIYTYDKFDQNMFNIAIGQLKQDVAFEIPYMTSLGRYAFALSFSSASIEQYVL